MVSRHTRVNGTEHPQGPGEERRNDAPARGAVRPQMNPGDEAPAGTPGTGEDVCPQCGGNGRLAGGARCEHCGGTGRVTQAIGGA